MRRLFAGLLALLTVCGPVMAVEVPLLPSSRIETTVPKAELPAVIPAAGLTLPAALLTPALAPVPEAGGPIQAAAPEGRPADAELSALASPQAPEAQARLVFDAQAGSVPAAADAPAVTVAAVPTLAAATQSP